MSSSVPPTSRIFFFHSSGVHRDLHSFPTRRSSDLFYYGYLHDATRGGVVAPDGGILFATLTHPGTVDAVSSAFAETSFNYNVFDVELARTFTPAEIGRAHV